MDTKPITECERALLRMPSIASQLPVEIAGGAGWSEFTGECHFCKQDIPDNLLRGSVAIPLPSVAVIEAVGGRLAHLAPAPTVWQRIRDFLGFPATYRGSSK